MMIGLDVYLFYGMRHSFLNKELFDNKSYKTVSWTGIGLVVLLAVVALLHHNSPDANDNGLFYFSMGFAALHAIIFLVTSVSKKSQKLK